MQRVIRKWMMAAVPTGVLTLAGSAMANPSLVKDLGLDVWNLQRHEQELAQADQLGHDLDEEFEVNSHRWRNNARTIQAVADGDMGLAAAAAQMWQLNAPNEGYRTTLIYTRTGPTMEARVAHNILFQVSNLLEGQPNRDRRLRALMAEFERTYRSPSPIQ